MLSVELNPDLDAKLKALSHQTGRPMSDHAEAAIRAYLEDCEDYALAEAALAEAEPSFSATEAKRELGLSD